MKINTLQQATYHLSIMVKVMLLSYDAVTVSKDRTLTVAAKLHFFLVIKQLNSCDKTTELTLSFSQHPCLLAFCLLG